MDKEILKKAFSFRMSRSGGSGGQHVNKVSTKVEVIFNLNESTLFTDQQKQKIASELGNRINSKGEIQVVCQSTRSQLKNKNFAIAKLIDLLQEALIEKVKRKPTRISRSAIEKRLQSKRINSEKKNWRGKIDY